MRWDEIASSDVTDVGEAMKIGAEPMCRYYLRVMTTSNEVVLLAEGLGAAERDELQVIADCITEAAAPADAAPAAVPVGAASSLVCPNCGSIVAPVDRDVTKCGACDHDVKVPDDVQNLVRNARVLAADRREEEQTITKVLDQPDALQVVMNQAAMFVMGLSSLIIWLTHRVPHVVGAVTFIIATVLLIVDRRTMSNRRAVQSFGRFFGAIAPAQKGAPATAEPAEPRFLSRTALRSSLACSVRRRICSRSIFEASPTALLKTEKISLRCLRLERVERNTRYGRASSG